MKDKTYKFSSTFIFSLVAIIITISLLLSIYNSINVYKVLKNDVAGISQRLIYLSDINDLIANVNYDNKVINRYFETGEITDLREVLKRENEEDEFYKFKQINYSFIGEIILYDVIKAYEQIESTKLQVLANICIYEDIPVQEISTSLKSIVNLQLKEAHTYSKNSYYNNAYSDFNNKVYDEIIKKFLLYAEELSNKTIVESISKVNLYCDKMYRIIAGQLARLVICIILYMVYIYIYYRSIIYPLKVYNEALNEDTINHNTQVKKFKYSEISMLANKVNKIMLKFKKRELEKEMKYNYMIKMIYEMKVALHTISDYINIDKQKQLTQREDKQIKYIEGEIEYLSNMMEKIIDVSKIDNEDFEINNIHYYISELFEKVIKIFKNQMEIKNIVFEYKLDSGLPLKLFGDEERIMQIIINLLDNACKYTKVGKVNFYLTGERISNEKILLKVIVEDTGIGINEEKQKEIFDESIDSQRSLGVGLLVSKKIANAMGGDITVESQMQKGSIFVATMEQRILDYREVGKVVKEDIVEEFTNKFIAPSARILIFDENSLNANKLQVVLKPYEMLIDNIQNFEIARNKLVTYSYDLIFLNLYESDENMEQFRILINTINNTSNRDTKFILLVPKRNVENLPKDIEMEIDDYITKPVDEYELQTSLERVLSKDSIKYLNV